MQRRNFLTTAAAGAFAATEALTPSTANAARPKETPEAHMQWQIWSRHLQWVSTQAEAAADPRGVGELVGQYAVQSGYAAVGLTVRGGGHIEPENVATHLPLMLQGIRSTGCICNHIGTSINPPLDGGDDTWIASQLVHEVLSVASAHGIERYRIANRGFTSNTYGAAMKAELQGMSANFARLAKINARYRLGALYHTQASIGVTVWEFMQVLGGAQRPGGGPAIPPHLVGVNFAIGHVGREMPLNGWQTALRYAMPSVRGLALHAPQLNRNPETGRLENTVVPAAESHLDFVPLYRYLLAGEYNGAAEMQIEHSIVGANGTPVSLNSAFFADNPQFVSGNLTPEIMVRELRQEYEFHRSRALEAGWTDAQMT